MRVINLVAGPGVGKSTTASGLFYNTKIRGVNAELVDEYAKQLTWDERHNTLEDQLYILAKQNRKLVRINEKVELAITDCPLLLGLVYAKSNYFTHFKPLVLELFNSYDNIVYYLERGFEYSEVGRNQTLEEACRIDENLYGMLVENEVPFTMVPARDGYVSFIMEDLIKRGVLK